MNRLRRLPLRIVDDQNKSGCSACDSASYELESCTDKDSICGAYVSARDTTSCRC